VRQCAYTVVPSASAAGNIIDLQRTLDVYERQRVHMLVGNVAAETDPIGHAERKFQCVTSGISFAARFEPYLVARAAVWEVICSSVHGTFALHVRNLAGGRDDCNVGRYVPRRRRCLPSESTCAARTYTCAPRREPPRRDATRRVAFSCSRAFRARVTSDATTRRDNKYNYYKPAAGRGGATRKMHLAREVAPEERTHARPHARGITRLAL